ncbi:MAG: ferrous iron transport protein B [Polyangiales bacterium]
MTEARTTGAERPPLILIAGNPNSGKTTLFNALTGSRARVGNYPGVTVDRRSGTLSLPGGREVELVDVPGTYSLTARSPEEEVAIDAILGRGGHEADAVVVVADATTLGRGLYLATQILETRLPVVLALNMMDEAREAGVEIDVSVLAASLGVPVVPIVASRGEGLAELRAAVARALEGEHQATARPAPTFDAELAASFDAIARVVEGKLVPAGSTLARAWALFCFLSLGDDELHGIDDTIRSVVATERARLDALGIDPDHALIAARYRFVDDVVARSVRRPEKAKVRMTDRVDRVLTHPVAGLVVFALVMLVVFQSLFSWADPLITLIEGGIAWVQELLIGALPAGPLRDLVVEGIVAGVGNVIVFVPQIALLFLFVTLLEDSGYLARVAFVIDRLMAGVGLHGKAFVPLLSGFACAVPAVLSTRTIESRKDRLVTMLALPLMSCSARLPVYVLVIATVFPVQRRILGVFSTGSIALLSMYALSVGATLAAAAILRRTVLRGPRPTFVLELPPYRMPVARNVGRAVWERVKSFLTEAGTLILACTIVLWALLSYPRDERAVARFEAERTQVTASVAEGPARDEALSAIDAHEAQHLLETSALGRFGRTLEPVIAPLGFDWRIGIGILGAFAAREVFVSTLGVVFGIEDADQESRPLRDALREARRPDGSPLFTPLVGASLMVFFVLAAQCMSTIAVVKRESGSWRWAGLMVGYMSVLAYVASLLVYQVGLLLGFGA